MSSEVQKSGHQRRKQKVIVSGPRKLKKIVNSLDSDFDKGMIYNIVSGCGASDFIYNFLLTTKWVWNLPREKFIAESVADEDRWGKSHQKESNNKLRTRY